MPCSERVLNTATETLSLENADYATIQHWVSKTNRGLHSLECDCILSKLMTVSSILFVSASRIPMSRLSAHPAPSATIDFSASSELVAQHLIGAILTVDGVGGRIVETEAYDREKPAAYSFPGGTPP